MQHSVGKLREMLEAHNFYSLAGGGGGAHAFRAPKKPPKRL